MTPLAQKSLFIGLMSGTSADGIDAALVRLEHDHIQLIDFITYPLPPAIKPQLISLNLRPEISLYALSELHAQLGKCFAQAAQTLLHQNGYIAANIQAIGSHGQTVFHAPDIPMTLQLGHPAFIAKQTGIPTVADFRMDDMALGGQGAPLAPAFHQALFQSQAKPCVLINIGGIANITLLTDAGTIGFDTGPGNGLMDEICQTYFDLPYDINGELAASSAPNPTLLAALLQHPYFARPAPKSTGRDLFNQAWLNSVINSTIEPTELLSTLNQLTVETLARALEQLNLTDHTPCYVCGGGAYNQTLLSRLQQRLPNLTITTTFALNIDPNAIEAMMCAWLAKQRLDHREIDLTHITGSQKPVILGGLWHP